jgi:hypothetical protein
LTFAVFASGLLAVALIGCSSAPTGSSSPTLAPGHTATPAPSGAPPTSGPTSGASGSPIAGTGHECDAVPTFSISNPNPASPPPDTGLLAHFPATIDGQPVTDVQATQWVWFLCAFAGQTAVDQALAQAGSGFNLATMSFGSAKATVDGESVDLSAFRTPGTDSNAMVQYLALLAAQSGTDINPGNVSSANIGGKNVYVWTNDDGTKGYAYPAGDTLISFDSVTDSQATKILAALP